jgi:pentapeptide repeat protein
METAQRRSLEETWRHLGDIMPRDGQGQPLIPPAMPSYDDEVLGFSFFRHIVEDDDLSNLTLPRTYFGRSGLERVSFRNTDLSESRMCWNDFKNCDFSWADLSRCDMRASLFENCKFVGAILRGADLRRSSFSGCDFGQADLTEAMADEEETIEYLYDKLTEGQQASMVWHDEPGEEPPGG